MAHSSESNHLLARVNSSQTQQTKICVCSPLKNLCLPSKAAALILLWTANVGMMYHTVMTTVSAVVALFIQQPNSALSMCAPLPYALFAIVMMFYPLSGFIADVCCGRLKTVVVSLVLLLISNVFILLGISVFQTMTHQNLRSLVLNQGIVVLILAVLSLLTFVVGLVGYQANFIIQLGLDQHQAVTWVSLFIMLHGLSSVLNHLCTS